MKQTILSRRDFLKTTVGGAAILIGPAAASALGRSKKTPLGEAPKGTIIISDMSKCQPSKNVHAGYKKDHWQLITFETAEAVKGIMASARPDERCGELTLPLNARGLYKIFLCIYDTKSHFRGSSSYGQLEVKLTKDAGFRRVGPENKTVDPDGTTKFGDDNPSINRVITEAYWKTADLTGQSLTFRQMPYPYNRPEHGRIANLSYIKLVPLTKQEKRQWQKLQPREDTRKLAMIFCTGQYTGHIRGTYTFRPTSKQWFKDEFAPYVNSDFKILIFDALRGSSCLYKTKIGSLGTKDNRWQDDWVDPLGEFTKLAHSNKMKIFASLRFIGVQHPMNIAPIAWAPNYWKNQELTMRTKEGVRITKLSLAYPKVRNYWLSLLREVLEYDIDGIQLHLNRSEPYVFYEEPVVQAFIKKYKKDPRKLDIEDPRWLEHSASYLTDFVRQVRELVNEKPGRELGITISGRDNDQPAYYEENHCDVETWIRERLVNYLMITPELHPTILKKWRKLGGNSLHIWPDLMPRSQTAASYAKTAQKYYEAGADGLCTWDGERRTAKITEWAAVQRLGHIKQLDQIIKEGPSYYRAVDLKTLGGFDVKWSFKDG